MTFAAVARTLGVLRPVLRRWNFLARSSLGPLPCRLSPVRPSGQLSVRPSSSPGRARWPIAGRPPPHASNQLLARSSSSCPRSRGRPSSTDGHSQWHAHFESAPHVGLPYCPGVLTYYESAVTENHWASMETTPAHPDFTPEALRHRLQRSGETTPAGVTAWWKPATTPFEISTEADLRSAVGNAWVAQELYLLSYSTSPSPGKPDRPSASSS